jgi:Ras-related protein Rab-2A
MPPQPWDYIAKIVSLGDSGCGKSSLTIRLCEGRFTQQHDVTIGVEFGSRIMSVGPPASLELGINNPAGSNDTSSSPPASKTSAPQTSAPSRPATLKSKAKPTVEELIQQKHMKLSLWDTAGQETYKSITRSYFRGASGALLVFDITRRATFNSVTSWLHDLRQIAEEGIIVVLVGNKSDLALANAESRVGSGSGRVEAKNQRQVTRQEAEEWCKENRVLQYVETSAKNGDGVERAFMEVAERIYQNIEAGRYDLNDRRSGVKVASAAGGQGGSGNTAKTVNLTVRDEIGGSGKAKGGGGGCC